MLIVSNGGYVNVALKDCPRCHGDGYWYEWKVDEEQTIPQATSATLTYQPFCNCAEEIRLAKKPATSDPLPAEPEAGAQVPPQVELMGDLITQLAEAVGFRPDSETYDGQKMLLHTIGLVEEMKVAKDEAYWDAIRNMARVEKHLVTIRDYVKEAQVVLITREDMHDPLKAQAFWDEAQGLYRLILSETGK
jgi:hypothetical protein